jgi:hypothetical protein
MLTYRALTARQEQRPIVPLIRSPKTCSNANPKNRPKMIFHVIELSIVVADAAATHGEGIAYDSTSNNGQIAY